jgi:hypothetical protein
MQQCLKRCAPPATCPIQKRDDLWVCRYYLLRRRWPDVANAFKYLLAQCVVRECSPVGSMRNRSMLHQVIVGAFHPIFGAAEATWNFTRTAWVVAYVASTAYTYFCASGTPNAPRTTHRLTRPSQGIFAWIGACGHATTRCARRDRALSAAERGRQEHPLLRSTRLYPTRWYYVAMAADLVRAAAVVCSCVRWLTRHRQHCAAPRRSCGSCGR